jgi:hypothetical protein
MCCMSPFAHPTMTDIELPAVYLLRRHHVLAALNYVLDAGLVDDDADGSLTVW